MIKIKQEYENIRKILEEKNHQFNSVVNLPVAEKKIYSLAKKYFFPKELIDFYNQYDGLKIFWFSDVNVLCSGSIFIPSLHKLKEYLEKPLKTDVKYVADYIEKGCIPLDVDFINKQITVIEPKGDSYILIRINYLGTKTIIDLSIEDYICLGVKVGGLNHWQNYTSKQNSDLFFQCTNDFFFDLIIEKLDKSLINKFYNPKISKSFELDEICKNEFNIPNDATQLTKVEHYGCSNHEIRKVELSINKKLPVSFVKWCYSNNGVELKWKKNKSFGDFKVLSIEKIFGGSSHSNSTKWENNYFKDMNLAKETEQKFSNYYSFIFEESGQTVFIIDNDKINLYFIADLKPVKINLNFISFIQKLKLCAGLSGWQHLFTNKYSYDCKRLKRSPILTNVVF